MKKKLEMRSLISILCILIILSAWSCSDDKGKDQINLKTFSLDYDLKEEVRQAQQVFKHLYLPMEMSDIFKNAGEEFNPTILCYPAEADQIIFSNEIALAMGIYGVNLGYVRLFEQWNLANSYLLVLKKLSAKIGMSEDIYNQLSEYLDHPVYNKDTLEYIANQIYVITDFNLRQNGRNKVSELIILGGWIEAMRLAIDIYFGEKNEFILQKIIDQQNSLISVMSLLEIIEGDEMIDAYLEQVNELNTLLRGLDASYKNYLENKNSQFYYNTMINYLRKIERIVKRMQEFAK